MLIGRQSERIWSCRRLWKTRTPKHAGNHSFTHTPSATDGSVGAHTTPRLDCPPQRPTRIWSCARSLMCWPVPPAKYQKMRISTHKSWQKMGSIASNCKYSPLVGHEINLLDHNQPSVLGISWNGMNKKPRITEKLSQKGKALFLETLVPVIRTHIHAHRRCLWVTVRKFKWHWT